MLLMLSNGNVAYAKKENRHVSYGKNRCADRFDFTDE